MRARSRRDPCPSIAAVGRKTVAVDGRNRGIPPLAARRPPSFGTCAPAACSDYDGRDPDRQRRTGRGAVPMTWAPPGARRERRGHGDEGVPASVLPPRRGGTRRIRADGDGLLDRVRGRAGPRVQARANDRDAQHVSVLLGRVRHPDVRPGRPREEREVRDHPHRGRPGSPGQSRHAVPEGRGPARVRPQPEPAQVSRSARARRGGVPAHRLGRCASTASRV